MNFLKRQQEERERQDRQWGGPEHDDEHEASAWIGFIRKQLDAAQYEAADLDVVEDQEQRDMRIDALVGRLVKIAALAQAAAESTVRRD